MQSRTELAQKWKQIKNLKRQASTRHIRPKKRKYKARPTTINTGPMESTFSYRIDVEWTENPLLHSIVPYKHNKAGTRHSENEAKIVRWVERGIHPFTKENHGPAAHRSPFDYLTDSQVDLAINLANEHNRN